MPSENWPNSVWDCLYFDDEADIGEQCKIAINANGDIEMRYIDNEGETIVYRGAQVEPGHFTVSCNAVNGRGTLHRFKDGRILEGYWVEDGQRGMWRIQLA